MYRQDIKECHLKTNLIESMHVGVETLRMHRREQSALIVGKPVEDIKKRWRMN